jgi:hypothetical protein
MLPLDKSTHAPHPGLTQFPTEPDFSKLKMGIPHRVEAAIRLLWESHTYAQDLAEDPWEFSLEWSELQRHGLTANDFRWLLRKGLIRQARETTAPTDARRSFAPCDKLPLSPDISVILSDEGLCLARRILERPSSERVGASGRSQPGRTSEQLHPGEAAARQIAPSEVPHWDPQRRELKVGREVVKEFRVPAPNQETVLAVFEEEKWPPRIDDPLPPKPGTDGHRRLHDTINSLNRNQRRRKLRFFADGLGRGVRWEKKEEGGS